MMSLTIGLAGMDPATETALKSAFAEANERLAGHWRLLPEADAELVIVDMDSMYGPMSWLRLHASGKRVIGLTSAPRAQTDYRLGRPFSAHSLGELLRGIAQDAGVELAAADTAPETAPSPIEAPAEAILEAAAAPEEDAPLAAAPVDAPPPADEPAPPECRQQRDGGEPDYIELDGVEDRPAEPLVGLESQGAGGDQRHCQEFGGGDQQDHGPVAVHG